MLFLLLLTFYLGTEATTVTLTEARYSTRYSWPALGRFRISVDCSYSISWFGLNFIQYKRQIGYIKWYTDVNQLEIVCTGGYNTSNLYPPVDCSAGGNVTYTVQLDTAAQELLVMQGGDVVTLNGCVDRPDEWRIQQNGASKISATDEGWKLYCNSLGKYSSKLTKVVGCVVPTK